MTLVLTQEQIALLPSEQEVDFYREHGWYISKPILSEEEIEDANYGAQRHYNGERDTSLPIVSGFLDWKETDGDILRQNDYVSMQNDQIRDFVFNPIIAAIAARLCGNNTMRLFHDQLIYKPAREAHSDSTVGWHRDIDYWQTCTSDNMLTAWIPFQDSDTHNGTLTFIDKSNNWVDDHNWRTFRDQDLAKLEAQFCPSGEPIRKVPVAVSAGQVSFHHCRTIHGSYSNLSDRPRIGLAVHMQDDTNCYCQAVDRHGKPVLHVNDLLCRRENGQPDYFDPTFCPILWDENQE